MNVTSAAGGSSFFPRFPNVLPIQPEFAGAPQRNAVDSVHFSARAEGHRSGMGLARFRENLLKHLDRQTARTDEPTDILTMTRRYGIAMLGATQREFSVTLYEKADAAKKEMVRQLITEKLGGSYHGKQIKITESPCRHLELGCYTGKERGK